MSGGESTTSQAANATPAPAAGDEHFREAQAALLRVIDRLHACPEEEKEHLRRDLADLQAMGQKLQTGRVEIVVFGEISTGKSALINALIGQTVTSVDVRGGWTRDIQRAAWGQSGYTLPGFAQSEVVLVDTPGLNEVGGAERADLARETARKADLILFVTDSDLNDTEFAALSALAEVHKPIIFVINKVDLYTREQRARLLTVLRDERLKGLVPPESVVTTSADPREMEYVIQSPDGGMRSEWKKPPPDVGDLKARILEVLESEGLALLALSAAIYAADKSDRIASLRVRLRDAAANKVIWSYAAVKSIAVSLNPVPVLDVLSGGAVDATMVATLAKIYGLELSWVHAQGLVTSILKGAGWVLLFSEVATHWGSSFLKAISLGKLTPLTMLPQGAAAGYGSYIVGQAAKYYFEHGASWGGLSAKAVVHKILDETDKQSVLAHLKDEIKSRLLRNPHAKG